MDKTNGFAPSENAEGIGAAIEALESLKLKGAEENRLRQAPGSRFAERERGAQWFSAPCWHNCGGRCTNKVLMKDGIPLRQKTDDAHEDCWERPQTRGCPLGRSAQQLVFGPDRIKYPMKRKGWSPENPNGQMRGRDEWERISWDEAMGIVAEQLEKAKREHGNESILMLNQAAAEGFLQPLLAKFGGYTDMASLESLGTFGLRPEFFGFDLNQSNDRFDLVNADYIVLYGHNSAWATFSSTYYLKPAHEKGIPFLFVGPEYNATAAAFDAKWFPVRQGTDTAFLLGVAFEMIAEDDEGSVIDWDFLDRCTVGFDAEHMPEGAPTNENFRDYVLGAYDGIPKTPEWASEICGCPVDRIREFAAIMGCKNNVTVYSNSAPGRNKGAENLPQLMMTVGAMGGHFGKPGNAVAMAIYGDSTFNGGPVRVTVPSNVYPWFINPTSIENPVPNIIPADQLWSAVLTGTYLDSGRVTHVLAPQQERSVDIHVIISGSFNKLQSNEGQSEGIKAFRKVDFVLSTAYWLKTDALYADIVLPVQTRWEYYSWSMYQSWLKDRDVAFAYEKVIEPLYEARTDLEIAKDLAERLGIDMSAEYSVDDTQSWFNAMAQTAVAANDDCTEYRPLLTITQEDIDRYGVEGEPQEGVLPLEEFLEAGVYRMERDPNEKPYVHYEAFRNDPEANRRPLSQSGKMEIYCTTKSFIIDAGNALNPNYTPVSPLPKYLPTTEGYTTSFEDWESKKKGRYPYLISNNHYLRRAHTDCDNLPWLREAFTNPVFISKHDAEEKGVQTGDVVIVFNDNGKVLRRASVSRCLMPGTMILPHGAAVQVDEETGIDLAGSDNYLVSAGKATCTGSNGYNSTLVDFEKYAGDITLDEDCQWQPRIPLAE